MGVTRVRVSSSLFFIQENMKNMKKCGRRPLLLSKRLPEMYVNNPKSDTQRLQDLVYAQP